MLLVLVALATFVVFATGAQAPRKASKNVALLSRARSADTGLSASRNDTSSRTSSSRPPSCVQNTGASCVTQGCGSSHGKMECRFGQCHCSNGCSSGEGVCHNQANVLVASGIRLKNVQWPTYYLIASTMDNFIHVANSYHDPLAQFNLYQLPGQGHNPEYFLLVPEGSPTHSVSVIHADRCSGIVDKISKDLMETIPKQLRERPIPPVGNLEKNPKDESTAERSPMSNQSCGHTWKAQTQPMSPSFSEHPSVQDIAVRLSQAPAATGGQAGAITIRGSGKSNDRFMFIYDGTYKVTTRADDPGLGGYWIPDPPLPFSLPAYDGPACRHNCHSRSVRSAMTASVLILGLLVALLF